MHANHHGEIDLTAPFCGFLVGFWVSSIVLAAGDALFFGGYAPMLGVLAVAGGVGTWTGWAAHVQEQTGEWPVPWRSAAQRDRQRADEPVTRRGG